MVKETAELYRYWRVLWNTRRPLYLLQGGASLERNAIFTSTPHVTTHPHLHMFGCKTLPTWYTWFWIDNC